jgi:hypothetical protein
LTLTFNLAKAKLGSKNKAGPVSVPRRKSLIQIITPLFPEQLITPKISQFERAHFRQNCSLTRATNQLCPDSLFFSHIGSRIFLLFALRREFWTSFWLLISCRVSGRANCSLLLQCLNIYIFKKVLQILFFLKQINFEIKTNLLVKK